MRLSKLCLPLLVTLVACKSFSADDGHPCLQFTHEIRPLLIGESARIPLGRISVSDCIAEEGLEATWSTSTPAIVDIDTSGLIIGKAVGPFEIAADVEDTNVTQEGFALPPGWQPRISPQQAVIRVGEKISFHVTAVDAKGRPLPAVPFSIYTPEFGQPDRDVVPIVDKYSHQNIMGPATFRAERVGRTKLRGVIGDEEVFANLQVVHA